MQSGDKIRFFFEANSFDEQDQLKHSKHDCLNKIGHSLHWHDPVFKKITFNERVKNVAKDLDFKDPAVVQGMYLIEFLNKIICTYLSDLTKFFLGMYIFKQPRIGTPVTPHQDGTFLFNNPLKLVGLWFPIDDATLENGCLWYVPGSHKLPIKSRFKRSPENKMVFEGKDHEMNDDDWVAAPVKKGT